MSDVAQPQVWWRKEPLTAQEKILMDSVLAAHHNSSYRDNASTAVVAQTADASGELAKAIGAGLLTIGGKHAPIEKTCFFLLLDRPEQEVFRILKIKNKVPGWGGTFQKDAPDPIWKEVSEILESHWPAMTAKLDAVTTELHKYGKKIYPNPSAYTAASGIVLGLGPKFSSYLFILGRITAWTHLAAHNMQERKDS